MNTLVRINMATLSAAEQQRPDAYAGLGGRGLTSEIVAKEVPPLCNPLAGHNKLVIAPGLLAGTNAANSGRLSIGAKSPLTGGIKESNAGGTAAHMLANLGIAAIVVENLPAKPSLYIIKISATGCEFIEANDFKGLGNYATVAKLTEKYGDKVSYLTIGQAGEMKLGAASIAITDRENRPTRHCGRGGMGAVMGSKGIKAIVIDTAGAKKPAMAEPARFSQAAKAFAKALMEHPVTSQGLPTYGTNILTNIINESGGFPTRNFTAGRFEGAEKISGETAHDNMVKRGGQFKHGCMPGCIIQCSGIYNDKDNKFLSKAPEYETVWAHGAHCGIDDLDAIALMDYLEDDIGVDTIDTGVAIGVAMDAGVIQYGDVPAAVDLVRQIGQGTPLGRIIGSGAAVTGRIFGVERIPVVKGQAIPAYDPRAVQGIGVTYATSTMGADHTAGYCTASNILGCGGKVDPLKAEGQVELSRNLQVATAAIDSAGLCLFVAFCVLDKPEALQAICDMISARFGIDFKVEDVGKAGVHVLQTERAFNRAAGFTEKDDRLPEFFTEEKLAPHNLVFMVSEKELDTTYNF